MRIALISFTQKGAKLNRDLVTHSDNVVGYHLSKYEEAGLVKVEKSLREWTREHFKSCDGLVYIGATGIAVRAIAPFLISKAKDPAVLTVDELGQNVIPLVSGHIGGANKLAREIAALTKGRAIISTATDLEDCFAVDEWAKDHNLILTDLRSAKLVSATLLQGETVGLTSDFPIVGPLPKGIALGQDYKIGIYIGYSNKKPYKETLRLIPKEISLGIGCKKGTSFEKIEALVKQELEKLELPIEAIKNIASINLKKEEVGLLEWAAYYKKPIYFYNAEELSEVLGDFTPSTFVKQTTGVDNVCERAAVRSSGQGVLIHRKTAKEGVTLALAISDYTVNFK